MAAKNNTPQEENSIDALNNTLTSAGDKIIKNRKPLLWAVGGVVVLALLVLGYIFFIQKPNAAKSSDAFNNVEVQAMGNDSIATAGYRSVADKYEGTDGGNLAALSAGEALYDEQKYEEAAKYLLKFKTSDDMMMANVECLIGDCYVGLKKYDAALNYFDKSIRTAAGNPQIVPRVLDKKARIYDEQKKYDLALKCYEEIEKDYPVYQNGNYPAKAYIAREKARLGK